MNTLKMDRTNIYFSTLVEFSTASTLLSAVPPAPLCNLFRFRNKHKGILSIH